MEASTPKIVVIKAPSSSSCSNSFVAKVEATYLYGRPKKEEENQRPRIVSSSEYSISLTSKLSQLLHLNAAKQGPLYKQKTFLSKGAILILLLNFLLWAGYGIPTVKGNSYYFYKSLSSDQPPSYLRDTIAILSWFPATLVFGLLADIRYGRKKVVIFGMLLLWLAVTVDCIRVTVFYYSPNFLHKNELFYTLFIVDAVLSYVATAAFLVNSVQLAIDQLIDASADQISSFIRWYIFTSVLGAWLFYILAFGPVYYCLENKLLVKVFASLAQVAFVSIALCLIAVCGDWIKESPVEGNPLKLIWQVLKFAAKHKHPVSRSALTYWEDEIPSRINLGKDKYGGPFTNEQVEDVKTFFRMFCFFVPGIISVASINLIDTNFIFSVRQKTNTPNGFQLHHEINR